MSLFNLLISKLPTGKLSSGLTILFAATGVMCVQIIVVFILPSTTSECPEYQFHSLINASQNRGEVSVNPGSAKFISPAKIFLTQLIFVQNISIKFKHLITYRFFYDLFNCCVDAILLTVNLKTYESI